MSAIPRALENASLDGGFWQIRTCAATWLNGKFWWTAAVRRWVKEWPESLDAASKAAIPLSTNLSRSVATPTTVAYAFTT